MSKSILVIDTPYQVCQKCELCYEYADGFMCAGNEKRIPDGEKPNWCPLKEIPEKIDENNTYTDQEYYRAQGWNSCIDEILGKIEG